jgi:Siphovirus ReqiPepy6 Gp37-like protein
MAVLSLVGSARATSAAAGTIARLFRVNASARSTSSAGGTIGREALIYGTSHPVVAATCWIGQTFSGNNGLSDSTALNFAAGRFVVTWEMDAWTQIQVSAIGGLPQPAYNPPSAGSQDIIWVEILDKNLVRQGPIQFANLTATLYYNAVGSWSMVVPYSDFLWNIMMAGDFFVNVNWRGLFSFGGKCEKPGYSDSIPGSTGASTTGTTTGPFITLSGADYLALLANRICYPTPGSTWTSQTAAGADTVTSLHLESAIKHYVNNNVGPGALSTRRVPLLSVAADQQRGPLVTYSVKFGSSVDLNLMDVIRNLIGSVGNGQTMGISITRNPTTHNLVFDCFVPRNLSNLAWFSRDLGNLTAIDFSLTDPTVTDALVQGSGTNFIHGTAPNTTVWNQTEVFNDSSSETSVSNLQATASSAIAAGTYGPQVQATVADTPFLTFGRDYGLGDIVTVEVRPGNYYSDTVSSVVLTADPTQTPPISAVPTIGQNSNTTATTTPTMTAELVTRIRNIERKLATLLW